MPDSQTDQIINLMFEAKKLGHDVPKHRFSYSPLHLRVLHFISNNHPTVMKDIADLFGVTPPSATSLIEGMVKSGLIARSAVRNDRRIVQLKLTKKGQILLKNGSQFFKKKIRAALADLTSVERATLIRIIEKLYNKFNL
ncbi:MAG: MarR family transcriptional regulator [Candidatus Doudnabacteria bacterium]